MLTYFYHLLSWAMASTLNVPFFFHSYVKSPEGKHSQNRNFHVLLKLLATAKKDLPFFCPRMGMMAQFCRVFPAIFDENHGGFLQIFPATSRHRGDVTAQSLLGQASGGPCWWPGAGKLSCWGK